MLVGVLVQGLASNLRSIPTHGENAFTFPGGPNQNLQSATANLIAAHLFHFHCSVQPTYIEALRTVGWITSLGASIKFGINARPW